MLQQLNKKKKHDKHYSLDILLANQILSILANSIKATIHLRHNVWALKVKSDKDLVRLKSKPINVMHWFILIRAVIPSHLI